MEQGGSAASREGHIEARQVLADRHRAFIEDDVDGEEHEGCGYWLEVICYWGRVEEEDGD